jgi:hypothetical protein
MSALATESLNPVTAELAPFALRYETISSFILQAIVDNLTSVQAELKGDPSGKDAAITRSKYVCFFMHSVTALCISEVPTFAPVTSEALVFKAVLSGFVVAAGVAFAVLVHPVVGMQPGDP